MTTAHEAKARARIRGILAEAGCDGWYHARLIGGNGQSIGDPDQPLVAAASMYKVPLLIAACRAIDSSELDPLERIVIDPEQGHRVPGPTGFCIFDDPISASTRDVLRQMIVVSDNTAAAAIRRALPHDAVARALSDLRIEGIDLVFGPPPELESASGASAWEDANYLQRASRPIDTGGDTKLENHDPAFLSHATPNALCELLELIWTGRAASPKQCEFMRTVLGQQAWSHRIASGFPGKGFAVAGKTGTIGRIRSEMAVVQPEGELPVAVSVITRAARFDPSLPEADAAIGKIARILVDYLRASYDAQ